MMLVPCGGCSRHVRVEEGPCPFCGAAVSLPARSKTVAVPPRVPESAEQSGSELVSRNGEERPRGGARAAELGPRARRRAPANSGATRAAIFYLGATLAACGGQSDPPPEPTIMQPYGAPPDPPEPPPDPSEPDVVDPPPPPPETDPSEPRAIVPPYGAPALPDSEH